MFVADWGGVTDGAGICKGKPPFFFSPGFVPTISFVQFVFEPDCAKAIANINAKAKTA
jgi:hypothetical protein